MGPRSPTSRCDKPTLSRNSREPLPSQIFTPASLSDRDDVLPRINQSSSAMTARWKTRLVVRRGRTRRPFSRSWNFNGLGEKIDNVPVPVLTHISSEIEKVHTLPLDVGKRPTGQVDARH